MWGINKNKDFIVVTSVLLVYKFINVVKTEAHIVAQTNCEIIKIVTTEHICNWA